MGVNSKHQLRGNKPSKQSNLYLPQRGRGTVAQAMVDEEIIVRLDKI